MQIWLFFALLVSIPLWAQPEGLPKKLPRFPNIYGENAGHQSIHSAWINPASLKKTDLWQIGAAQVPFHQKGWPSQIWTLLQAPWTSPTAVGISFWGDSDYQLIGLHLLRKQRIHRRVNLGLRLGFFQEAVRFGRPQWLYDATLGVQYRYHKNQLALVWSFGLAQASSFQLAWQAPLDEHWYMSNSLVLNALQRLQINSSFKYQAQEKLFFNLGLNYPTAWSVDLSSGWQWNQWQLQVGVRLQPYLGFSSPTLMSWSW